MFFRGADSAVTTASVSELRQNLQTYLAEAARKRLRGSVIEFRDPVRPALDPAKWNMSR